MTGFKKLVFTLALLLTFSSFGSNNITLELKIIGQDYYSIDGNNLTGSYSNIQGHFNVSGVIDGQQLNVGQAIPATKVPSQTTIKVLDRKAVQITDAQHGISGIAKAKVRKSLGGKVKSLFISSDEYLTVMGPILEQSGMDLLTQMQIQADDAVLKTSMDISDIDCEKVGGMLRCDSDVTIIIEVSDR